MVARKFQCFDVACIDSFGTPLKRELHFASAHAPLSTHSDDDISVSGSNEAVVAPPVMGKTFESDTGASLEENHGEIPDFTMPQNDEPSSQEAPTIEPAWDVGKVPEWAKERPGETPAKPTEFVPPMPTAVKAFGENEVASLLTLVFETTASMARTGPEGELNERQAKMLANLLTDSVNRYLAGVTGGDPGRAKLIMGVSLLMLLKARVYASAIRGGHKEIGSTPAVEPSDNLAAKMDTEDTPDNAVPTPPGLYFVEDAPINDDETVVTDEG
jgi:hypothetical protein